MLSIPVFAALSSGVLDMPGHFSVTAYVPVCNARCPYCYNKKMMAMAPTFTLGDALAQLEKLRKYAPDAGLVLSGGEPTAHPLLRNCSRQCPPTFLSACTPTGCADARACPTGWRRSS